MLIKCDFCNKEINHFPCRIKRHKNHFCDKECHRLWQTKNQSMEDNPNWKGGKYLTPIGYVMVYSPGHPRQNNWGYVYEHVLIAENFYGVSTIGKHVHHINGIKSDNRPENLAIVKPKDHEGNTFVKILQNKIKELENEILKLKSL